MVLGAQDWIEYLQDPAFEAIVMARVRPYGDRNYTTFADTLQACHIACREAIAEALFGWFALDVGP